MSDLIQWSAVAVLAMSLLFGAPVAYSLLLSGFIGLVGAIGIENTVSLVAALPLTSTGNYTLTTIPTFVLMAELLSQGRVSHLFFEAAKHWFGGLPGGLGVGVVGASAGFGALSGSSVAAAALMSRVAVPEMRAAGYSERFALGVVASSGTLAVLLPPSTALIIYGVVTDTSIGALFVAGIIPGLATALIYAIIVVIWANNRPASIPRIGWTPWSMRLRSLKNILPAIPLLVVVLGSIYTGAATPTEAGAVGAVGALILSWFLGGLRLRGLKEALDNTVVISAMLLFVIFSATVFQRFLSVAHIPELLSTALAESGLAPWALMIAIVALYLVLGFFMSMSGVLLLTLPIIFPVVTSLGYDPIWFGIVVVKTVEFGLSTPPVGLNLFVTHGAAGGRFEDVVTGASVFLAGDALILATLLVAPGLLIF